MVVPESGSVTIRIQALLRREGVVELALLCEDTGFAVNHFATKCRFEPQAAPRDVVPELHTHDAERVPLDPATDLYDDLLFHTGRFRRVEGYRRLTATECVAELSSDPADAWFGGELPQELVLGDPAARDAAIHAIQACIPHRRVLPVRMERMVVSAQSAPGGRVVLAKERTRTADEFIYDVVVKDADGRVLESWEGLCLRAVETIARQKPWAGALLAPYLERRLGELLPDAPLAVGVLAGGNGARANRSADALRRAVGTEVDLVTRPDGRPELAGADRRHVSTSHTHGLTLAICGAPRLSCDVESVETRTTEEWTALLSDEQQRLAKLIARESGEDFSTAATRVWTAAECLKKAGLPGGPASPLTLGAREDNDWLMLGSPLAQVATWVAQTRSTAQPAAFAFLTETAHREPPPAAKPQRTFEYRHVVTFEETNVVGNVYFVNHLSWQGRCREMFLRENALNAIKELDEQGLSLATSSVAVEYFEELFPFDEVVVRMTLRELTPDSAALVFDYLRKKDDTLTLIARGQHTVAVKHKAGAPASSASAPAIFPDELRLALERYLPGA